jgi:hypothetical protein
MVENTNKTSYYIQTASEILILIIFILGIPNIFLSSNQLDFSGYYNPQSRVFLYIFRARDLYWLTNQKLV